MGGLVLAWLLAPCLAVAQPVQSNRNRGCRFAVPAGLDVTRGAAWLGECRAGLAEGAGVLRSRKDSAWPLMFLGTLRSGHPIAGVMGPGINSYIAEAEPGQQQAQFADSYDQAVLGARVASEWFEAHHDRTTAAYFRRLSRGYENSRE